MKNIVDGKCWGVNGKCTCMHVHIAATCNHVYVYGYYAIMPDSSQWHLIMHWVIAMSVWLKIH